MNIQDAIAELETRRSKAEDESDLDENEPGIDGYGEARYQEGRASAFEEAIGLLRDP